ncbi:MAG: hypothetical protein IPK26_14750 [Planctomycetes bacterium]|nr:hypothetical protein [Planctomycetota bacterium]
MSWLRKHGVHANDLEDLAQEVMLRVLRNESHRDVRDWVGYTREVARRVALEHSRGERRNRIRVGSESLQTAAVADCGMVGTGIGPSHEVCDLAEVLGRCTTLGAQEIQLGLLVFVARLTVREAAEQMRCGPGAARAMRESVRREIDNNPVNSRAIRSLLS